jgi:hypothetical protein
LGITSKLTGYLIHSHHYYSREPTKHFWEMQCQIIKQLWIIRSLSIHSSIQRTTIVQFPQGLVMVFGAMVGLSPTLSSHSPTTETRIDLPLALYAQQLRNWLQAHQASIPAAHPILAHCAIYLGAV